MIFVLVTGATGFLGEYVVRNLIDAGMGVRALVRKTSDVSFIGTSDVEICYGDLDKISSIELALEGVDILINLASLGYEYVSNIVEAAVNQGVERAVFVSTTSIFSKLDTTTKFRRIQSELIIAESGLLYTIIRPTMIYGSPRDRNIWRLIEFMKKWSFVPVIGGGTALQQPVYVNDVAKCILRTMVCDDSIRQSYNIAGLHSLSYLEIINLIMTRMDVNVRKIYCPVIFARIITELFGKIGLGITSEQILRFSEDKVVDNSLAIQHLGYSPLDFAQGLEFELQWLRK